GGTEALRIAPIGGNRKGSNVAMALVESGAFGDVTLDVDLEGNGEDRPAFLGVAFAVADAQTYEAVYFRPFNFRADEAHRTHALQYVAWPEHTWEALRSRAPGVYEASLDPPPDPAKWFHARVEVTATKVSVFVNDGAKAALTVDRLRPNAT